jgi:voltage-gated potassium channel
MDTLRNYLQRDTISQKFEAFIALIIIASVISFSLETLPDLPLHIASTLSTLEYVFVTIFTAEYLLRVFTAERPLKFIFSFYGIIDLLAIAPFYMSGLVGLETLKLMRLFRLVRVLKLMRYGSALKRFYDAIAESREELIIFFTATMIVIFLAAVGIYHFEHQAQPDAFRSIFDALWWSVVTLTTVGYGDLYPITDGGRLFTFLILLAGLGLIAVPTGIIASALNSVRREQEQEEKEQEEERDSDSV